MNDESYKDDGMPEPNLDELVRLQGAVVRTMQRSLLATPNASATAFSAMAAALPANVEALKRLQEMAKQ